LLKGIKEAVDGNAKHNFPETTKRQQAYQTYN
jgi:hypothetical protein